MRKTVYIFRHDWKFAMRLILVLLIVAGTSFTSGAAYILRVTSSRPLRVTQIDRLPQILLTPRVEVQQDAIPVTPLEKAIQAERFNQNINQHTKAIQQLQEQMAAVQLALTNVAKTESDDRNTTNHRMDLFEGRISGLLWGFGALSGFLAFLVGILSVIEFIRRRDKVPNYPIS